LTPLLHPVRKVAVVLGSGASSLTAASVLEQEEIIVHRVSRFPRPGLLGYGDLADILPNCMLVVNTPPAGMYPHNESFPLLPYSALTPNHVLFDFVYNPSMTRFLQLGQAQGATVVNGLSMLRYQAEKAWEIWED